MALQSGVPLMGNSRRATPKTVFDVYDLIVEVADPRIGGVCSFPVAAKMLTLLTDLQVASRTINNKTIAIGLELAAARDEQADAHAARPITQAAKVAEPAVSLAVAQVDGGRMQTD